jgi:hypothetical protein
MTDYIAPKIFRLGEAVLLTAGFITNVFRNEIDLPSFTEKPHTQSPNG